MQTLRKLSSKKGKFEGLQLGEVVSKNINKLDSPKDAPKVTQVITHSNTIASNKNKETANKRAEQVAQAIQKRHDYYSIKKMLPKEPEVTSPIISIKLVKNESSKAEKKRSVVKPKLVSDSKRRQVSFTIPSKREDEKPRLVSPTLKEVKQIMTGKVSKPVSKAVSPVTKTVSPKAVSPVTKTVSPKPVSPVSPVTKTVSPKAVSHVSKTVSSKVEPASKKSETIQKRQRSPSPSRISYKTIEVRTILDNYEISSPPYITDYRYKTLKKHIHLYNNLPHAVDKIILASISQNITF